MKSALFACVILLIAASSAPGQPVRSAHCSEDGKLYLTYGNGKTKPISKEPGQVACEAAVIATDKHTVGWSILAANCCTSYPIPMAVGVLHNNQKKIFWTVQMVWHWQFSDDSKHLAILTGPTHGGGAAATLYNIRSGRQLAQWTGEGATPSWASAWEGEFPTKDRK